MTENVRKETELVPETERSESSARSSVGQKILAAAALTASAAVGVAAGHQWGLERGEKIGRSASHPSETGLSWEDQQSKEMGPEAEKVKQAADKITKDAVKLFEQAIKESQSPDAPTTLYEERPGAFPPAITAEDGKAYSVSTKEVSMYIHNQGGGYCKLKLTHVSSMQDLRNDGKRTITDYKMTKDTVTEVAVQEFDSQGNLVVEYAIQQGGVIFPTKPTSVEIIPHGDGERMSETSINKKTVDDDPDRNKPARTALGAINKVIKEANKIMPKEEP